MSLVGVSIVNVALPSIQLGLGATQSELQWVLSGYALTFGVGLVAAGRAGDVFGRGPLFILGVAVFTGASVVSAFAPDILSLNLARLLAGLGSGILNPQGVGMIQQYFRGAERARAFGVFGGAVGVSVAVGPLLGGLLIEAAGVQNGWRWTFLINVPVGVLAIILALLWIPRPLFNRIPFAKRDSEGTLLEKRQSLDPVGALLLGFAVLAVMIPFMEGREAPVYWLLLPVGPIFLLVWLWWE